jgi:hypothetical protein
MLRSWIDVEDGTLIRWPSLSPGPMGVGGDAVTKEDEDEFKLISQYRIMDKSGNVLGKAAAYIKYRDDYFGGPEDYRAFAAETEEELADNPGLLKLIEDHGGKIAAPAKKIFYRWVRKALLNHDGNADVPALIRAGMTQDLKDRLKKVRLSYKGSFSAGGFNPRPIKLGGRYKLGTLSEHALGEAVDIQDSKNPQLTLTQWRFVEEFTGKSVVRTLARWKSQPEQLWKDIVGINDAFVSKLANEIAKAEVSQKAAAAKAPPLPKEKLKPPPKPIDLVFETAIGKKWEKQSADVNKLKQWEDGFFSLDWALVKLLHEQELVWGATFSNNVDLHHFEIPSDS